MIIFGTAFLRLALIGIHECTYLCTYLSLIIVLVNRDRKVFVMSCNLTGSEDDPFEGLENPEIGWSLAFCNVNFLTF